MATLNFSCTHCGRLMAVLDTSLGQQVRCPHCQQVVTAPAASAGPPAPPALQPLSEAEQQSLFGSVLGPEEAPPVPAGASAESPAAAQVAAAPEPSAEAADGVSASPRGEWPAPAAGAPAIAPAPEGPPAARAAARRRANLFLILVVVPLISYALLSTVALVYLLFIKPKPPDPMEIMPDVEGDNVGGKRLNDARGSYKMPAVDSPLPDRLVGKLNQAVRVGDLEVKALRVDRGRPDAVPNARDALVLRLELRNVSSDVVFKPMDGFFDRRWVPRSEEPRPFTCLVVGDKWVFGGPYKWSPQGTAPGPPEPFGPRHYDRALGPGEAVETYVCTDWTRPEAADALRGHSGKLLWRVQVRRGLVRGRKGDVSATAVVGIEFTKDDINSLQ